MKAAGLFYNTSNYLPQKHRRRPSEPFPLQVVELGDSDDMATVGAELEGLAMGRGGVVIKR